MVDPKSPPPTPPLAAISASNAVFCYINPSKAIYWGLKCTLYFMVILSLLRIKMWQLYFRKYPLSFPEYPSDINQEFD